MDQRPWAIPSLLRDPDVSLLRAEDQVFDAMMHGWRAQMLARGLTTSWINSSTGIVRRFHAFTNEYPWNWQVHDVDDYFASLRSREKPLALATLRAYNSVIRIFCSYLTEAQYGWAGYCEEAFGAVPTQICFDWNSPKHTVDDAAADGRRPFTRIELQRFFDAADDLVDREYAAGSKRWLPALRDSTAFKVCYAFGLRRRELQMMETVDFGPNPHVPAYKGFGSAQVRFAKGTKGSGPRQRTVLTSPEFDWVTELLEFWLSPEGRSRFPTADRSLSLWPSERAGRLTLRTLDRSFQAIRELAQLPEKLTMHSLRHSYVTHQIEAGYDPTFIQHQVGHSNASVTALYTHVSSDFKHKTVLQMIARRLNSEEQ
ncbi:tyrosine-type recombinase/integrase [Arthrobacter sp. TMN-50]